MLHVPVDVAGHEDIEQSVAVIITKAWTGGPVAKSYSGRFGDIGKRPVVIIVLESILSVIGHVKVWPAVVVIVTHRHAESPSVIRHARCFCHVGEGSVVIIVE